MAVLVMVSIVVVPPTTSVQTVQLMRTRPRHNLLKKHSTYPERIVYEILKELKLSFRHRWLVGGREIDFLIGSLAIEIDGHPQNGLKNQELLALGLTPVHISNEQIISNREELKVFIKELCFNQKEQIHS